MKNINFVCLFTLIFVACPHLSTQEPIHNCETDGQYVADADSCTIFHRCRALSTDGPSTRYTTDIAICDFDSVFDLVTQECVQIESGLLQDPESCNTYYGCDISTETTEGYVRHLYYCPGELRFHPEVKTCIYKTRVEDSLCNNHQVNQMIIRADIGVSGAGFNPLQSLIRPSAIVPNRPSFGALRNDITNADSDVRAPVASATPVLSGQQNNRRVPIGPRPAEANIDEIAQVISGQLFSLRDTRTNEKVKGRKSDKKEEKKEEVKEEEIKKEEKKPEAKSGKQDKVQSRVIPQEKGAIIQSSKNSRFFIFPHKN